MKRQHGSKGGKAMLKASTVLASLGAFTASTLMASSAWAQVDQITVTATKRVENLQDVPISVTAFNAEAIERVKAESLRDLEFVVPNFNYSGNEFNRRPDITLRGITGAVRNPGEDGSIGFYVDGVFLPRPTDWNQDLFDLERVEVLRGPQGSLFGKNTIAGAILFTTKKPTDELSFDLSGEYGNFDHQRVRAAVNVPLVEDTVFGRVSLNYFQRDGYVENLAGPDHQDEDRISARAALRILPSDNVTIDISGDYMNENPKRFGRETINPASALFVPGRHTIALNTTSVNDRTIAGGNITIEAALGTHTLTSITAYRDTEVIFEFDEDHTPDDLLKTRIVDTAETFSQEIRLASEEKQFYDYLIGFLYLNSNHAQGDGFVMHGADDSRFPGATSAGREATSITYAAFANTNIRPADRVTVNVGLRLSYEDKELLYRRINTDGGFLSGLFEDFPTDGQFLDTLNEVQFSPTVGLEYQVNDDILTYVKWSRGNKSGGWNAGLSYRGQEPFDAEQVDNYEIGLKSEFLDNRLRANLAAFVMDYSDLQVTTFAGLESGMPFNVSNAAKAKIRGMEADLAFNPIEGLQITGGVGYLDTEYENYQVNATTSYDGNRLTRAPKWTANLSSEYTFPVNSSFEGVIGGSWTYRGDLYTSPSNADVTLVPSFSLYNARAGIADADGDWDIFFWMKNVTDKEYLVDRNGFAPGEDFGIFGAPRLYGVTVSARF